ncbi:hypothetical protein ACFOEK_03250 [Litoribrevibacter euphylliae]|uniref:Uncharacterized protein n=1 Tax=Litoribrevibacter euphylliae TaxID=1834034 RepID=A0ABV7H809_9GAMM
MDKQDIQLKILAQAVYELRLLLSHHLGSTDKAMACETLSAQDKKDARHPVVESTMT